MKVGLFIPCYINAVYPEVGIASYKLLKNLGIDVDYPSNQTCCGQPMANAGFENKANDLASHFDEIFNNYEYVVGPSASCVAFIRDHYDQLLNKKEHRCFCEKKTYEICEHHYRLSFHIKSAFRIVVMVSGYYISHHRLNLIFLIIINCTIYYR